MKNKGNEKRYGKKKGQVAFEFLVIYTMFMIAFIATIYFSSQRAIFQQLYAEQIYAREIGMRFAQEINTAAEFPGYSKLYTFSNTIRGSKYNLSVYDGSLILFYKETGVFYYPLMTKNVSINGFDTNIMTRGIDTLTGSMVIRNVNGKVEITQ